MTFSLSGGNRIPWGFSTLFGARTSRSSGNPAGVVRSQIRLLPRVIAASHS
jgi:hypothetical protein